MAKTRVTKKQMQIICERIADGTSLTRICNEDCSLPSWRTVLRWVQEDEDAYTQYRVARTLQCEVMRDQIIDLVEAPLPDDPKLAMAEVQRHRLKQITRTSIFGRCNRLACVTKRRTASKAAGRSRCRGAMQSLQS